MAQYLQFPGCTPARMNVYIRIDPDETESGSFSDGVLTIEAKTLQDAVSRFREELQRIAPEIDFTANPAAAPGS